MNVFILNSGRVGSTTFIQACKHFTNYTSGHESLVQKLGSKRLDYPDNHVEADNRLSWFLGRLNDAYGDNAFYVHLTRNLEDTARSFSKRRDFGILKAYEQGILMHEEPDAPIDELARDYINTVNSNINIFLKDKQNTMVMSLENINSDFPVFYEKISAKGDLDAAMQEWNTNYNAS